MHACVWYVLAICDVVMWYVWTCVSTCVSVHLCMSARVFICAYIHMYVRNTYVRTYVCMCMCAHVHVFPLCVHTYIVMWLRYVCVCMCVCVCVCMYTHL